MARPYLNHWTTGAKIIIKKMGPAGLSPAFLILRKQKSCFEPATFAFHISNVRATFCR